MNPKQDGWIRRINEANIPVFKETVKSIAKITADQDSSTSELAAAILRDPSLTARILKFANSPIYNPSRKSASTVTQAVVVLGFDAVKELSLSLAIIDSLLQSEKKEQMAALVARAFHGAVQARFLAERLGAGRLEEVFIATLLYDLGEMAFWCMASDMEIAQLKENRQKPGLTFVQAQKMTLGFCFDELTAGLIEGWEISNFLRQNLSGELDADPRAQAVKLGRDLATALAIGWNAGEIKPVLRRIMTFLNTTAEGEIETVLRENAIEAGIAARSYGLKKPARLIPGGHDGSTDGEAGCAEEVQVVYPNFDPSLQLRILREVTAMLKTKPDLNLILEMLLEGIHRGLGMDRAVFAVYVPLRAHVRAKFAVGADAAALMDSFVFPVDAGIDNPFTQVMREPGTGLWVKNTLASGFSPTVMEQIRSALRVKAFFLTPIIVSGRPIGVFYGDRKPSKRPLDALSFESFEHFGQQACIAIEYISLAERK